VDQANIAFVKIVLVTSMRIHAEGTDVTKCDTTGNTLSKDLYWTMGNQKTRNIS